MRISIRLVERTLTNLEIVFLKVPAPTLRQDRMLADAYVRRLPRNARPWGLLEVARRGFEIRSKILGYEVI
jgi:hypothetical protein